MKLVDYEKYYHSGSEFIIPRDEFEKIIEQLEAYENMRKEAIEYIEDNSVFLENDEYEVLNKKDLLNILNKIGGSDE